MSCDFARLDGAYVLGSLGAAERAAFERHLAGCADCTHRVRELAGMPGLLGRVPAEVLESPAAPEPVPATLLPALVAEVRRDQRRRTARLATLVAAAAVILTAGSAAIVSTLGEDGSSTPAPPSADAAPAQRLHSVSEAVTGSVSLTGVAWGTRLDLECSYEERYELPAGSTYALFVRTTDGRVEQVATWRALPGRSMQLTAATSALPGDIASVVVRTGDGEPVLRLATARTP